MECDKLCIYKVELEAQNSALQAHQKDLVDEKLRFQTVFDLSPVGFVIARRAGDVVEINKAGRNILGEGAVGKALQCFMAQPDTEQFYVRGNVLYDTGEIQEYPVHINKNGSSVWVMVRESLIHRREGLMRCITLSDISAIKAAEEKAQAASEAKSQFLAVMSHELRTPMNCIMGMTDLVLESQLADQQRKFLGMVKGSSHRLLSLINSILSLSRIEAGKELADEKDFDVHDLVREVLEQCKFMISDKDLKLSATVDDSVPRLRGDEQRLHQVLTNLVANAVKFTDSGDVVVSVLDESVGDGVRLRFAVSDTGIGISNSKIAHLFQYFGRLDASSRKKYQGSGLGLAISKNIVEGMGGAIWVESVEGKGSTFHFTVEMNRV